MQKQSVSNSVVKKLNLRAVFTFIYENGPVTVRDISSGLGMSVPTVSQNMKELSERALIAPEGTSDSTGGRKARVYGVAPNSLNAIGLDLTRHDANLVILNLMGEAVYHVSSDLEFEDSPAYYHRACQLITDSIEKSGVRPETVVGVGISIPAIISGDGTHTTNADPLSGKVVHLTDFTGRLSYPCRLFNDASAGGYAEFFATSPSAETIEQKNLVYLSVSKTVGGSAMIGGRLYEGDDQHAAEFGHMVLVPEGRVCYCGQWGCAYSYINTRILSDAADGSLDLFFRRLREGADEGICKIWNEYLYYLSLTVSNLRAVYDCDVIIGGYLGAYLAPYMEQLRALCAQHNNFERSGDFVRLCSHPMHVSATGAALSFLHKAMEDV